MTCSVSDEARVSDPMRRTSITSEPVVALERNARRWGDRAGAFRCRWPTARAACSSTAWRSARRGREGLRTPVDGVTLRLCSEQSRQRSRMPGPGI